MRLIDADELIKDRVDNDFVKIAAENAPTVYDINKIIQQLESNKENIIKITKKVCERYFVPEKGDALVSLFERYTRDQIEIVRKGGV